MVMKTFHSSLLGNICNILDYMQMQYSKTLTTLSILIHITCCELNIFAKQFLTQTKITKQSPVSNTYMIF